MNKKIPFHELSAHIASATGISNESAELFVRNFFELISDSLINGESIRIKGLGSFSITEADSEKNISFIPDKEFADSINAPFAMFEPVRLNDQVSDEMLSEVITDIEPEKKENGNEVITDEGDVDITIPIEEIKEDMSGVSEIVTPTELPPTIEIPEQEGLQTAALQEASQDISTDIKDSDERSELEANNDYTECDVSEPQVELQAPEERIEEPVKPVDIADRSAIDKIRNTASPLEEEPEEYVVAENRQSTSGNGGNFWWGMIIGLIVGIALGACGIYLAIDYLFPIGSSVVNEQTEATIDEIISEMPMEDESITPMDSIGAPVTTSDTIKAPVEPVIPSEPVAETPKIVRDTIRPGYLIHDMAKKFYGSKDFWVYIYEENKAKIGNPNRMQPGVVLTIPPAEKYGIVPGNQESIRKAKNKAGSILSKYPK